MIHLSDRETAVLIDALAIAAGNESARAVDALCRRSSPAADEARASEAAIREVLAKINARMTPATFGLHVATEGEVAVGDQLQSAASRTADWIINAHAVQDVPYEVFQAACEGRSASDQWTAVRRG